MSKKQYYSPFTSSEYFPDENETWCKDQVLPSPQILSHLQDNNFFLVSRRLFYTYLPAFPSRHEKSVRFKRNLNQEVAPIMGIDLIGTVGDGKKSRGVLQVAEPDRECLLKGCRTLPLKYKVDFGGGIAMGCLSHAFTLEYAREEG